jgi:transposase-like protein
MERRRCKITDNKQSRLLEMFVGGVTARTAADLVGVNRHTATLFYQKIRSMIAFEMEDESPFCGEIELDESYFGGHRKGKRGVVRVEKFQFLVSSNAVARFIRRLFQMPQVPHSCRLLNRKYVLIQLFIPIVGQLITR